MHGAANLLIPASSEFFLHMMLRSCDGIKMQNVTPCVLVALILSFTTLSTLAGPDRGVWFWGSTTIPDDGGGTTSSAYGSNNVVGDPGLEADSLAFFKLHHVKRVYGSYGNRPISEAGVISAWNEKLYCLRIESQLLLEALSVSHVDDIPDLLEKITNRLINFNDGYPGEPEKHFHALHLDIEPQQTPPYSGGSAADKRAVLDELFTTYSAIRSHLDSNGYAHVEMYADIPYTWDKIPGSIGWADPADRDAWFASLKTVLDGLSIMTFSKDTAPELDVATAYERAGVLDGFSRIAIQPKVGVVDPPTIIWPDYPTFNGVLNDLEALIEEDETTDIENFGLWRHAIDSTGLGYTLRNRGLWFWESNPLGTGGGIYQTLSVVGDPIKEDEAIDFMTARQVKRLFGQYPGRPHTEPATIAAWNTKLHDHCIESESLFYGKLLHSSALKTEMLNNIQMSFIDYMDTYPTDIPSQFDALRLQLAPQHMSEWDSGDAAFRRTQLDNVLDILTDSRALLDSGGYTDMPLFADIAHDWDILPADGGEVGWADAADRDDWTATLHTIVDGVTITAFEEDDATDIQNVTAYERAGQLPTKARIGMRSNVGPGELWPSLAAYEAEREIVEDATGAAQSVDIDSYANWRTAIESGYFTTSISGTMEFDGSSNLDYIFPGKPSHLYIVRFSTELDGIYNAPELMRLRNPSSQDNPICATIPITGNRGFWVIETIKD
jgi:hypothetical protein